jgi:hypothetical protein
MNGIEMYQLPYPQVVAAMFNREPALNDFGNIVHATLGLVGETGEVARASTMADLIEELGDVEFYLQAFVNFTGWATFRGERAVQPRGMQQLQVDLMVQATALADCVKKAWVYGPTAFRLADDRTAAALEGVVDTLDAIYRLLGVSHETVVTGNVIKLDKKFPGRAFSTARPVDPLDV